MKIGIDPGHGGEDSGEIGSSGLKEKEITLAVGMLLGNALKDNGLDVVYTREKDTTVKLPVRTDLLNRAKCDVIISLHVNAAGDSKKNYLTTRVQSKKGKAEVLALFVQRRLVAATGWRDGGVHEAKVPVIQETRIPTIIVELGFISNPGQEKWLAVPEHQRKLAHAIAQGILEFWGQPYQEPEVKKGKESLAGKKIDREVKVMLGGKEIPAGMIRTEEGKEKALVQLSDIADLLRLQFKYDPETKTITVKT
ncbi:N-acetylmuramoyl-L-alanine amidase family protein [Candidatus Formimonas warabiya]|uniref:MurNAc-LAA domain-containing protein n=1 Tax=Formimonas warabiya TaxID=1761012 RepID=A0A3G1KWS9_FORW1|nr:N-acetylmuramoyl-L-alanine amidase [Candidatus Formimonas warabiya]ATW26906.1 hypothetical protein DCMF_20995 [Candidatus Formimonas warabiya]